MRARCMMSAQHSQRRLSVSTQMPLRTGRLLLTLDTNITCPSCTHEFSLQQGFAKKALERLEEMRAPARSRGYAMRSGWRSKSGRSSSPAREPRAAQAEAEAPQKNCSRNREKRMPGTWQKFAASLRNLRLLGFRSCKNALPQSATRSCKEFGIEKRRSRRSRKTYRPA